MKKFLYLSILVCSLLSIPASLTAKVNSDDDGNQKKSIRIFLNTGETFDFKASEIDSITMTAKAQYVWKGNIYKSFDIESIDSVWYITPTLRMTTTEVNFGKVAVGNKKTINVSLTNTGEYPESFFLFAEGVFSVVGSGTDVSIDAGRSKNIEITYKPNSASSQKGMLLISSSSIDESLLKLPLVGEGVDAESEEENAILPPVDQDFEVVLPEDVSVDDLDGFKIVNCYGEFPIEKPASARKIKKGGTNYMSWSTPGLISNNGLQLNFLTDRFNNPFLFSITLPKEKPELSITETAISILMTDPLLITSNEAEYSNMVKIITELDEFWTFRQEVADIYYKAKGNNPMCPYPDYSTVNTAPIFYKLIEKVKDNSGLTLDGLSLDDILKQYGLIKFRVRNDRKRVVHIYPSKVKLTENSYGIAEQEDDTQTLTELCQWILTSSDMVANELDKEKNKEELEFIEDLKEWVSEVERLLIKVGLGSENSHIQVPIILQSKHADYWKIVGEAYDAWFNDLEESIYEVVTDEIATDINKVVKVETENGIEEEVIPDYYDMVYVDVYGLGAKDKIWDSLSGKDKFRCLLAMLHGYYKDFIRPLMDFGAGLCDAVNAAGSDDYKYDFRYGARKAPEMALLIKLNQDFVKDSKNMEELRKNTMNLDFWGFTKQMTTFIIDRILSCPDEDPTDKRTYTNLIYNIYKKWTGNTATSKKFRDNFKAVANNLTYLKKANFAGKVIKTSEYALDLAGAVDAFCRSSLKQTFMIAKDEDPYINIIKPDMQLTEPASDVYFEWNTHKAHYFGNYWYELVLNIETPDRVFNVTAQSNITESHCNINLRSILSSNNANDALMVRYQIVAYQPENPSFIYTKTNFYTLYTTLTTDVPEFIDFDLPSGTLWSTCNLGAASSRDFGNYYAWGETSGYDEGKTSFSWSNYKYCKGTSTSLLKYCTKTSYGNNNFTDGIEKLMGGDDRAKCLYGYKDDYEYCIPSKEDWDELISNCRWSRLDNGVMIRRNNKVLFLPAAGYRNGLNLYDDNSEGYYWSSTLDRNSPDDAWFLYFGNKNQSTYDYYRCYGRSIRPVLKKKKSVESSQASSARAIEPKVETPVEKLFDGIVVKSISRSAATINRNNNN